MKLLKNIFKWLGIVIIALLAISFLLPNTKHIERTGIVKATPEITFSLINNFHEWEKWDPWHRMDTVMKIAYLNEGIGKGAAYTWDSKKLGQGKMQITATEENKSVSTLLHFGEHNGGTPGKFELVPTNEGTKVIWSMDMCADSCPMYMRPMAKYMNLLMEKMIAPDFEKGLINLNEQAVKSK